MFHLLVYTEEDSKKIEKHLTLFEHIYNCKGNKFEIKENRDEYFENNDSKFILTTQREDERKLKEEKLINYKYELFVKNDKIAYYTCKCLQLLGHYGDNLNLYLIEEEEEEEEEKEDKDKDKEREKAVENEAEVQKEESEKEKKKEKEKEKKRGNEEREINKENAVQFPDSTKEIKQNDIFVNKEYEQDDIKEEKEVNGDDDDDNINKEDEYDINKEEKSDTNEEDDDDDDVKVEKEKEKEKEKEEKLKGEKLKGEKEKKEKEKKEKEKKEKKNTQKLKDKENYYSVKEMRKKDQKKENEKSKTENRSSQKCKNDNKEKGNILHTGAFNIHLPLRRSKTLLICSLPNSVSVFDLFVLVHEYVDFIEVVKILEMKTSFQFLNKNENWEVLFAKPTDDNKLSTKTNDKAFNRTAEEMGQTEVPIVEEESKEKRSVHEKTTELKEDEELWSSYSLEKKEEKEKNENEQTEQTHINSELQSKSQHFIDTVAKVDSDIILFFKDMYDIFKKKLKKKKIINCYSVLLIFKTQLYADMFYKQFHGKQIKSLINAKHLQHMKKRLLCNTYVYCVFVSLVYFITDGEVENDMKQNGPIKEEIYQEQTENKYKEKKNTGNKVGKECITEILQILEKQEKQEKREKQEKQEKREKQEKQQKQEKQEKQEKRDYIGHEKETLYEDLKYSQNSNISKNVCCVNECNQFLMKLKDETAGTTQFEDTYKIKIKNIFQQFDINNYAPVLTSLVIDSNVCICVCLVCLELLDNYVFDTVTRNYDLTIHIKKNNNMSNYINISCNICMWKIVYEVVQKLFNLVSEDYIRKSFAKVTSAYLRGKEKIGRNRKQKEDEKEKGQEKEGKEEVKQVEEKGGDGGLIRGKAKNRGKEKIEEVEVKTVTVNVIETVVLWKYLEAVFINEPMYPKRIFSNEKGQEIDGMQKGQDDNISIQKEKEKVILTILRLNEILNMFKCKDCEHRENLWICLICSNIGCGRYEKGHAKMHSTKYNHNYCMNLKTKTVWNYEQDTFIRENCDRGYISSLNQCHNTPKKSSYMNVNITEENMSYCHINQSKSESVNDNTYTSNTYMNTSDYDIPYYMYNLEREQLEAFDKMELIDQYYQLEQIMNAGSPEQNRIIYNKIFDIFTNEVYISDNLKNEFLYILYSTLSHESNRYNNILVDLQYNYINKLERKKKIQKIILERIQEINAQNHKIEEYIFTINRLIKYKNAENTRLKQDVDFFKNLNDTLIKEQKNNKDEQDNDNNEIEELDAVIKELEKELEEAMKKV